MGDITKTPRRRVTKTLTAAASLVPEDAGVIFLNNTGPFTVTLPPVSGNAGIEFEFVKTSSDANAVTIDGFGSETINGAANLATIDAQFDAATVVSNGTAWYISRSKIA
jgi:hypothetical protein